MSERQNFTDIAFYSIGGSDLMAALKNGTIAFENATDEGGAIPYIYSSPSNVKRSATISVSGMSNIIGVDRVTNIDVSAATIGGIDVLAHTRRGNIRVSLSHEEGSAAKDLWKYPSVVKAEISGSIEIAVPLAAIPAIPAMVSGTSPNNAYQTFSLNMGTGAAFTFPGIITKLTHGLEYEKLQMLTVDFSGRSPLSATAYPTSPTGTTGLIAKAFNAPNTALAFDIRTKTGTGGIKYTGNVKYQSLDISFEDSKITSVAFEFATCGEVVQAATT